MNNMNDDGGARDVLDTLATTDELADYLETYAAADPLIRTKSKDLAAAGVGYAPRFMPGRQIPGRKDPGSALASGTQRLVP